MPRYLVAIVNHVGRSIEVDADTPQQAADQVWETDAYQNMRGLCHQCSGHVGDLGDWDLDEHEGQPIVDLVDWEP